MRKVLRSILIFLTFLYAQIFSLLIPIPANAECSERACVEVHVIEGKIVIEGRRDGSTTKATPAVTRTRIFTPKPSIKPSIKSSIKPSIRATSRVNRKPIIRSTSPKPGASRASLSDRILQSLPTFQVAYQPEGKALTRVPVIFFTDLPKFFNKTYRVLGVPVRINVHPSSLWDFGDGATLITSKSGKPYPSTEITHTYSVPGIYIVKVKTIWTGSYTLAGVTAPLDGAIRQESVVDVKVVGASTRFVGK